MLSINTKDIILDLEEVDAFTKNLVNTYQSKQIKKFLRKFKNKDLNEQATLYQFYEKIISYYMLYIFEEKYEFLEEIFKRGIESTPLEKSEITKEIMSEYIDIFMYIRSFRNCILILLKKLNSPVHQKKFISTGGELVSNEPKDLFVDLFMSISLIPRLFPARKKHKEVNLEEFNLINYLNSSLSILDLSSAMLIKNFFNIKVDYGISISEDRIVFEGVELDIVNKEHLDFFNTCLTSVKSNIKETFIK